MIRLAVFPPSYHDVPGVGGFGGGALPLGSGSTKLNESFTELAGAGLTDAEAALTDVEASAANVRAQLMLKNGVSLDGKNSAEAQAKQQRLDAEIKKFDKDGNGSFNLDEFNALTQDLVDQDLKPTADLSAKETAAVKNHITTRDDKTNHGVRDTQRELNALIEAGKIPGPPLKEDGLEGPKTRAAKAAAGPLLAEYHQDAEQLKAAEKAWNEAPEGPAKQAAEKQLTDLGDAFNQKWSKPQQDPKNLAPTSGGSATTGGKTSTLGDSNTSTTAIRNPRLPAPQPTPTPTPKPTPVPLGQTALNGLDAVRRPAALDPLQALVNDTSLKRGDRLMKMLEQMNAMPAGPTKDLANKTFQQELDKANPQETLDLMNQWGGRSDFTPETAINQAQRLEIYNKLTVPGSTNQTEKSYMAACILRAASNDPTHASGTIEMDPTTISWAVANMTDAQLAKLSPKTLTALASGCNDPYELQRLKTTIGQQPVKIDLGGGDPPVKSSNPLQQIADDPKLSTSAKLMQMFEAVLGGKVPHINIPGSPGNPNGLITGSFPDLGPMKALLDKASPTDLAQFVTQLGARGLKPEQVLTGPMLKQVLDKLTNQDSTTDVARGYIAASILRASTNKGGAGVDAIQLSVKDVNLTVTQMTPADLAKLKPATLQALASAATDPRAKEMLAQALKATSNQTTTIPLGGPPNPKISANPDDDPKDTPPAQGPTRKDSPAKTPKPAKSPKAKKAHKAKKKHRFLHGLKNVVKHVGKTVVKAAVQQQAPTSVPV